MKHHTVQLISAIPGLVTVNSLEQEYFRGTLDDWRGAHQLEFCWQPVSCFISCNVRRLKEYNFDDSKRNLF